MELGTDGEVQITIRRRTFDGEPTHWEVEASMSGEQIDGWVEGTAPTLYGVTDMVFEYLSDIDENRWSQFDANTRTE